MPIEKIKQTKIITTRSLSVIIFVLVGILISAQLRAIPTRIFDPIAPYVSLRQTRDNLSDEQNQLKKEIKKLNSDISVVRSAKESATLGLKELDQLDYKKALAGLTGIEGEGIAVVLDDAKSGTTTEDSIVHAADLRDLVNSLWGAGAEGVSINNQRVVINTAIDCIVNSILVNNVRISAPFTIQAIGDKEILFERISSPILLSGLAERKEKDGLIFDISRNESIKLPAFDGTFDIKSESIK